MTGRRRRLLLVTHRPLSYGGGGSARWRYFTEALPELGWDVAVVSARANPSANEFSAEPLAKGLSAGRARVMSTAGRVARPLANRMGVQPEAFPPSMLWGIHGRAVVAGGIGRQRPDVVLATVPPMAAAFAAAPAAARAGIPFVAEFRDLWAGDDYYDAGGALLTRLQARALARAAAVVCVTEEAAERMADMHPELRPRIATLPNGFDPRLLDLRARVERQERRRLTILHAGALYGGRSIEALGEALAQPGLDGRFRLELLGTVDPVEREGLERVEAGLEVEVTPPTSWEEATRRMAAADILLVIAAPGHDTAVPGKLYEALALGRPTLVISAPGSATARLMRVIGREEWNADFDDSCAIARVARRLADEPFAPLEPDELSAWNRREVARRLVELLEGLI